MGFMGFFVTSSGVLFRSELMTFAEDARFLDFIFQT